MQARIRHVAVMCQDAPRVARFYELLFALAAKAQTSCQDVRRAGFRIKTSRTALRANDHRE
jgi:predicted enzyme related to lactoylglutathione lyase